MTDQNNAGSGYRDEEYESVIDMLRSAASDETIPDEVSGLDGGDKTKAGPASHKFAEQQKTLKTAISLIDKQREQLKAKTDESSGQDGAGTVTQPTLGGRQAQDEAIYRALSGQALQNLGTYQKTVLQLLLT